MSSSVSENPKAYLVERSGTGTYELFGDVEDARTFSRSLPGSTVRELVVRDSQSPRRVTFERRVRVSNGAVARDLWTEEINFHSADTEITDEVDVESYESPNGDWNVVGIGSSTSHVRSAVDSAVGHYLSPMKR
jgi:hypothetical protein